MPAPSWDHVAIVMNLVLMLGPMVQSLGGRLATAPADVFFEGANPVQPDIMAMLPGGGAIGHGRGIEGVPDLLIEVLSPSNRSHDVLTKRALYARAGVGEYWILDPMNQTVEMLTLDRDALHTAQHAAGDDDAISPLRGDIAFPLARIFAGTDAREY